MKKNTSSTGSQPIRSVNSAKNEQRKTTSGSLVAQNNFVEDEKRRPQTNADSTKSKSTGIGHLQQKGDCRQKAQQDQEKYQQQQKEYETSDEEGEEVLLPPERENLVKMVSAFLTKNHCQLANQKFLEEIYARNNPINQRFRTISNLIAAFQSGKRDAFFKRWYNLPHQNQPHTIDKLEFYLQIYFLIYEIHPLSAQKKERIDNERVEYFRQYLDSKGSELSKTTELLSFYALPYIPKPSEHVGFKQLFTAEWVRDLSEKLSVALEKLVLSANEQNEASQLEELCQASYKQKPIPSQNQAADASYFITDNSYMHDNTVVRNNDAQYLNVLQELNARYSNLHRVYIQVQEQAKQAIMDSHSKWFSIGQNLAQLSKEVGHHMG